MMGRSNHVKLYEYLYRHVCPTQSTVLCRNTPSCPALWAFCSHSARNERCIASCSGLYIEWILRNGNTANDPGRVTHHHRASWHVLSDDGSCTNCGPGPYLQPR